MFMTSPIQSVKRWQKILVAFTGMMARCRTHAQLLPAGLLALWLLPFCKTVTSR